MQICRLQDGRSPGGTAFQCVKPACFNQVLCKTCCEIEVMGGCIGVVIACMWCLCSYVPATPDRQDYLSAYTEKEVRARLERATPREQAPAVPPQQIAVAGTTKVVQEWVRACHALAYAAMQDNFKNAPQFHIPKNTMIWLISRSFTLPLCKAWFNQVASSSRKIRNTP